MARVAIYLRLSREDEREGESASMENQRSYLRQYAAERGWTVAREYGDDGWSGLRFDRPQFQQMLADIDGGEIDTVLTKDLSRLGRDQIYTAFYYQIYFPQRGVRYIAVAEGLDTGQGGGASALFPFLTAANDFYTADVSRKVRAALTARKREGKFIGAHAPLGYAKDPERPGHLVVDGEAAPLVRGIFLRYLRLGSVSGVARALTEEGVPTPTQYREGGKGVWSPTMVRRILTNPTYAGHLTQNRRVKVNYKIKKRKNLPPEEWITVPNTHEAIVEQEIFDRVQEELALRSYRRTGGGGHLLTGLARCADCGAPMTYVRESPARVYMVCRTYRQGGGRCTAHSVREDRVLSTLRGALKDGAAGLNRQRLAAAWERGRSRRESDGQGERLALRLERQGAALARLYEDRAAGTLEEGEFQTLLDQIRKTRAALEEELNRLRENRSGAGAALEELMTFETLDRGLVAGLVEEVLVHGDKGVEIRFRFRCPDEREG